MTEQLIDLKAHIRNIPDFPKPGIQFKDITTLLLNPDAFRFTVRQLADRYRDSGINKIVGVESRGFIFSSALAYELGIGLVPVRKVGKLPATCIKQTYDLEYGTDVLEMHEDAIQEGDTVLVLDDVIATGGTLVAACKLAETLKAQIVETVAIVELDFLNGREKLEGRPFHSLVQF